MVVELLWYLLRHAVESKVAELERIIGQYAAENTPLKRALKSLEVSAASRPSSPKQSGGAGTGGEKR